MRRGVDVRHEAVGIGLAAGLAGWIAISAAVNPGSRPGPQLGAVALAVAAYVAGRTLGSIQYVDAVALLAVPVVAAGLVLGADDGLSGDPLAGPLGYGNANGALCLLGVSGAVIAFALVRNRVARFAAAGLAIVCTVLALETRSTAAAGLSVVLLIGTALAEVAPRRPLRIIAVVLPVAVLGATIVIGYTYDSGASRTSAVDRAVDSTVTERRVVLWSESLDLVGDHPLTGVGPGRFAETAPTAIADQDARWSHSLVLQQAAETGLPGAAMVIALVAWAVARLGPSRRTSVTVALVAAGLVLTHADIDYIAHFPAITGFTAGLVGLATQRRRRVSR